MYLVDQNTLSDDFLRAWSAAGKHIQSKGGPGVKWLRMNPYQPMAEHLSFLLGNQLFFVHIHAAEFGRVPCEAFFKLSRLANATPCIMPMRETLLGYDVFRHGWGLVHAETGAEIDPPAMITSEVVEMSDWELHDFAIKVVASHIEKNGLRLMSTCSDPEINPQLWFEDNGTENIVIVRAARYPEDRPQLDDTIIDIGSRVLGNPDAGYFAPMTVANADDPFDPDAKTSGIFLPLYRGYALTHKPVELTQIF